MLLVVADVSDVRVECDDSWLLDVSVVTLDVLSASVDELVELTDVSVEVELVLWYSVCELDDFELEDDWPTVLDEYDDEDVVSVRDDSLVAVELDTECEVDVSLVAVELDTDIDELVSDGEVLDVVMSSELDVDVLLLEVLTE